MSYQGHEVNFSQIDDTQKRINAAVNLDLYKYPQNSYLASARSDSDLWRWLGQNVTGKSSSQSGGNAHYSWGSNSNAIVPTIKNNTNAIQALDTAVRQIISQGTGGGMTRQQVEGIIEEYHGDDIALLHSKSMSLGDSQQAAKAQRDSMEAKIQSNKDEHSDFHTKLTDLGIALQGHSDSPHNGGGGGIMSYLPLIAVGGLAAYLLKGKLKL